MGQFTLKILGTQTSNMKLIIASLLACASAIPIELTPEVAEATAAHLAAVAQNEAGEHAALAPKAAYLEDVAEVKEAKALFKAAFDAAPDASLQAAGPVFTGVQIPAVYLEDTAEVAEAKASFKAAFDTAPADPAYLKDVPEVVAAKAAFDAPAAGEHAALAPINNDVQAPAPVHVVPAPLAAAPVVVAKAAAPAVLPHAYYGGYGYNGLGYAGLGYNGLGYAGYGYGLPVVAAPAPAEA